MYLISKLFTYIFLPPSIFIWLLVLGGFLAKKFKPLFFGGAILFYLLSIKPITNLLLTPLETIDIAHKKGELVVVLSGGSNPDDILKSAPDAFKRVTYGIVLAKTNNIPLLFTGGGIIKPTEDEMAKKDIELFQNSFNFKLKTYYENKALDTVENGKFSLEVVKENNLSKNIYLVTSAYHMKRSIIIFRHFGFNVIPKPVGFFVEKRNYNFYDFLPNMGNFHKSYKAIHEYFGIISLWLRGYDIFYV
jgi:uncharacterized SAM-binding protein YcdF (DUF218 family)